jgi:hypothetical protein
MIWARVVSSNWSHDIFRVSFFTNDHYICDRSIINIRLSQPSVLWVVTPRDSITISSIHEQFIRRSLNDFKKSATLPEWDHGSRNIIQNSPEITNFEGVNPFQLRREFEWQSINSRSFLIYEKWTHWVKILKTNLSSAVKHWEWVYRSNVSDHQCDVN